MDSMGILSLPNEKMIEICENLSDSDLSNLMRSNRTIYNACLNLLDERKELSDIRKNYIKKTVKNSVLQHRRAEVYPKLHGKNYYEFDYGISTGMYTLVTHTSFENIDDALKIIDQLPVDETWQINLPKDPIIRNKNVTEETMLKSLRNQ